MWQINILCTLRGEVFCTANAGNPSIMWRTDDCYDYNAVKIFNGIEIVGWITINNYCYDIVSGVSIPYPCITSTLHPEPVVYSTPAVVSYCPCRSKNRITGSLDIVMNAVAIECSPPNNDQTHAHPLSVLYVDDEPVLLNICKQYLERRSDIEVTTAVSVKQALILLETSCFDVIISDYQMPDTDGIGFLKILQERKCSIPFILFTGRGREEVVIEAINNGATYYIQKGGDPKSQFAELNHKIREASRRRHAEEALHRSELYYRTLFENSGTAIILLDEDLKIQQSNAEFAHISGFSRNEIDGILHLTDIISPEDVPRIQEFCRFLYRGPGTAMPPFEISILSRDQYVRYLTTTIALIPMTGQCIASFIDHNRLHQLEEEHRRMFAGRHGICQQSLIRRGNPMPGLREKPMG